MRPVVLWLAAVLVGISACSREPVSSPVSSPSSSPVSPTPVAPAPPVPAVNENLLRVWLCCGSAQVDINRQRQLEVRATYKDGSSEDVTAVATGWKSSNPSIASVSPTGVVSGLAAGNFEISASYGGLDATWGLYVVQSEFRPPASDEVTGVVSELTALGAIKLWRADVEVLGGSANGRVVQTNTSGLFRIAGVQAPGFDLIVRRRGYAPAHVRVGELGRELDVVVSPAEGMVSEVFEGDVCWPTRTVSRAFTPATPGVLRITSSRQQSTIREVYADGVRLTAHLSDNNDLELSAGVRYELRVTGSCDYNPAVTVKMTLLRPAS